MKYTYELSIIMKDLLAGNKKAFQEFYLLTANDVYFHVKQIVNNDEEAARLMIRIYKRLNMRLDRLQRPEDTIKWMNDIMYGFLMEWINVHCGIMLMDEEMGRYDQMPVSVPHEGGASMMTEAETAALAAGYVSQLIQIHAITGLAFFYDSMEMSDIAELLQCDESRINTRTTYVRKLIESYCKDYAKVNNVEIQPVDVHMILLAYVFLAKETVMPGMRELYFDIAQEIAD